MEFDMGKHSRGKAGQRVYLTKKERWGEITITHTTPTKPDMEVPPRMPERPKRKKRELGAPLSEAFPGLEGWQTLSPARRERIEAEALEEALKDRRLHHLG